MTELSELQVKATKLVHWPSGATYACDHHAEALQKIGSSMRIHIAVEDYILDDKQCANCCNEDSIARGDSDAR
jgi:hypothetical protein